MKAKYDENCEDCVHLEPYRDGNGCFCTESGVSRRRDKETCDKFRLNQIARITRSLHTIAWNIEELGNMMAAERHKGDLKGEKSNTRDVEPEQGTCDVCRRETLVHDFMGDCICAECYGEICSPEDDYAD